MTGSGVIAALTWRRFMRGRTRWVLLFLGLLPVAFMGIQAANAPSWGLDDAWRETVRFTLQLPVVLGAAVLMAAALGEEFEHKTYTYLWSRPIPRGSLITGKLLVAVPACMVVFGLGLTTAYLIARPSGQDSPGLAQTLAACTMACFGCCAQAAGIGAVFTRRALPATVGLGLVSGMLSNFVRSIGGATVSFHAMALAGVLTAEQVGTDDPPSALSAIIGAVVVSAVWLAVAFWRASVAEPPPDEAAR